MTILFENVSCNLALALWVHVAAAGNFVAACSHDVDCVGKRDARERHRWHNHIYVEQTLDVVTVLVFYSGESSNQQLLLNRHDVEVRVDPRNFNVDRHKLGGVTRSERWVGAKNWPDFEDATEASHHRHLLVELRALRQVGVAVEVFELEQLGVRLGWRAHELRRVNLAEVVFVPVLAPSVLDGGLNLEDQVHFGAAKVEESPVETLVDRGVIGNRANRFGEGYNLEVVELNFEATELYALVVNESTGDPNERTVGEARNLGGKRVVFDRQFVNHWARVGDLNVTRFVAQNDELDALLIAQFLDPTT